jgi:hypothetical protein
MDNEEIEKQGIIGYAYAINSSQLLLHKTGPHQQLKSSLVCMALKDATAVNWWESLKKLLLMSRMPNAKRMYMKGAMIEASVCM